MTLAAPEINDAKQAVNDDSKLNHLVAVQLQKTKMCAMHQRGTCRDPKCRFAHSPDELRAAPNLTKTAICRMYTRGQCNNNGCKFAHGEQELRVTPTVYKTQLCNFHMRGHCKKGNRCRHAHGDDELRSFLSQASTSPPASASPALSEEEEKTGFYEEVGNPYESNDFQALISPLAGHWPSMGPFPEWWAANPQSPSNMCISPTDSQFTEWWASTPPPTNMSHLLNDSQASPEKLVPPFPGAPKSSAGNSGIAEPMKIALPSSCTPGLLSSSPINSPENANMMAAKHAAQMAWAAQANMDYELAAAQLKVQELQVKRQMYTAARFAATAPANNGMQVVTGGQDGHFESIMNTLQKPSFPPSPVATPPPGLETASSGTAWVI